MRREISPGGKNSGVDRTGTLTQSRRDRALARFQQKGPDLFGDRALQLLFPATSYSPIGNPYSTIGAGGLNDRVRDGNGCITSAIATGKPMTNTFSGMVLAVREVSMVNMVKPHGPLVPVSFNHYWSFTSGLSTS